SSRLEERNRYAALVARMENTMDTARQNLGATASTMSGQQLLNQVSRTTRQFDIKPTRLQPEGSDGVSVWFDDVAFNDLMRWLDSQTRSGIGVKQMSVDREESAGTVNARVVLSGTSG
ncbi:MAG: type II secretion system protein GspM, partial [Pseudomonadota bacterium]|nr:type II secretion system protein GspM [Pseudomonadota bacterium]